MVDIPLPPRREVAPLPPPSPEAPKAPRPETGPQFELPREQIEMPVEERTLDKAIEGLLGALKKTKKKKPTTIPQVRDDLTVQVEKILEEELEDAFKALTPIEQQEFKMKGEQTAFEIRHLLKKTHVSVRKIFTLIFEWLKMLPGINRFFLEQEAKIKADKIFALKRK